jgi:hypothetical protein
MHNKNKHKHSNHGTLMQTQKKWIISIMYLK